MSSIILNSMIRSSIESSIRSAARETANASHHTARRIDAMSATMRDGMIGIRGDMMEGMGGIMHSIEAMSEKVENGIHKISFQNRENAAMLRSIGISVDVMSENITTGFGLTLDKIEKIHSTLEEIKLGIQNPEKMRALEAYRVARLMAEKGRPLEALKYATDAIENRNSLSMGHIPELRFLRGAIYMGIYDTAEQSAINGNLAKVELEEALTFADKKAAPMIRDHLAITLFGIGDFVGAKTIYEGMRGRITQFGRTDTRLGRCLLSLGEIGEAKKVFSEIYARDIHASIEFAADPVCGAHPEVFRDIYRSHRKSVASLINNGVSASARGKAEIGAISAKMESLVEDLLSAHRKAVSEVKKTPEYALLEKRMRSFDTAVLKLSFEFPELCHRDFSAKKKKYDSEKAVFDRDMRRSSQRSPAAKITGDIPDWRGISQAMDAIQKDLFDNTQLLKKLQALSPLALKFYKDCLYNKGVPRIDAILSHVSVRVVFTEKFCPPPFEEPRKPGIMARMIGTRAEDPEAVSERRKMHRYHATVAAEKDIQRSLRPIIRKIQEMVDERTARISSPILAEIADLGSRSMGQVAAQNERLLEIEKFSLVCEDLLSDKPAGKSPGQSFGAPKP